MKSVKMIIAALAVASTLMITSSCNKKANEQATSKVAFKLTDAPAQFDAMFIDVEGVQAHIQGGGWVSFNSSLGVINILEYVNGNTTLIAEGEIAAGATIDAIRLDLGTQNSVVVNGINYSLAGASSLQQNLTILTSNQLQAGGEYEWTIDFDAAQSVTATGSGSFTLTPTIRLIVDPVTFNGSINGNGGITTGGSGTVDIDGDGTVTVSGLSGNVSGNIASSIGLASVCLTGADNTTICTMTSLNGQFNLQAVAAGTYTMQIDPVLPLLSTHTMSNINVTAGQTTNLGLVSF